MSVIHTQIQIKLVLGINHTATLSFYFCFTVLIKNFFQHSLFIMETKLN